MTGVSTSTKIKYNPLGINEVTDKIPHTYLGAYIMYLFQGQVHSVEIPYYGTFTIEENGLRFERTVSGDGIVIRNISGLSERLFAIILGFDF